MLINTHFRCPKCRRWLHSPKGESVTCPNCGTEGKPTTLAEDGAKVIAMECVSRIEGLLLPGEHHAAFDEFREIIRHGIDAVLVLYRRELGEPSMN